VNPEQSLEWRQLTRLAAEAITKPLSARTADPNRFADFSFSAAGLLLDLSKQHLDKNSLEVLLQLAQASDFPAAREALFSGDEINNTEGRAVGHTALRATAAERPAIAAGVSEVTQRLQQTVEAIRSGSWRGATGKTISNIVHIGIGGSHLGPELVYEAVAQPLGQKPRVHFVANIDAHALSATLADLDPERTLFVIVSKSFSTLETKINAQSARSWFLERMADPEAITRHFLAVSSNPEAASAFGIPEANRFELWDWVGGRYSLWSAVGLSIMLAAGNRAFAALLEGARAMDQHFLHSPSAANLPLLMALTGIWNYNFLGVTNHAILPYTQRLRLLPDYLQQLMMESNGKSVHRDGSPVAIHTMPIVWGGAGTNGQHAYHQLLHQGTRSFTADFIVCASDEHGLKDHHHWLLANALGQSQAMLAGDKNADPHKVVRGNHATTTLVLPDLQPHSIGALLALYEHTTFCQGVIWQINSFDQWGVELGKNLARPIFNQLGGSSTLTQDASTAGLIDYLRSAEAHRDR
jgi:glucose-6-phosphate isomerase